MPQERSLQNRVLAPKHLVGRRERPSQLRSPRKLQSPRPQVKAQGRSQESKKSWRKKGIPHWGRKTQGRLPKSQRPSSSRLLVNLPEKLPTPPNSGPKKPRVPQSTEISDSAGRKPRRSRRAVGPRCSLLQERGLDLKILRTPTSNSGLCSWASETVA